MASVKILSMLNFTLFLTLLLLSSRTYCQDSDASEDCEEDEDPGKGSRAKDLEKDVSKLIGDVEKLSSKVLGGKPKPGEGGTNIEINIVDLSPVTDLLDSSVVKELSDLLMKIADLLTKLLTTLIDAAGGSKDPTAALISLFEQLLKLLSNLVDTIITGITGITSKATSQVFEALPEPLSKALREPVETILNYVYEILYGVDDALKGLANKDGAAVLKGLGRALTAAINLVKSL